MNKIQFFYFLPLLFLVSTVLVFLYKNFAIKYKIMDDPNARSSHQVPRPVGGGIVFIGLWLSWLFCLVIFLHFFHHKHYLWTILPAMVLIALVGFLDDLYELPIKWRFFVYLIVAVLTLVLFEGFPSIDIGFRLLHLGILGSILVVIAVIWSINLYNFMDGIDGIAAIEALFVFGIGGVFLWFSNGHMLALLSWGIASMVGGFLVWNFPPAKIFMGDVGSTFLGLLVPLFALYGERFNHLPALLWVMLYGFFIFDATVTLIRRILSGEKWYQAHRKHAFLRLHLSHATNSHRKALGIICLVNFVIAIIAILAFIFISYLLLYFLLEIVVLTLFYLWIEKRHPMYSP